MTVRHATPIVSCTATHMQGGPYAYASHYALSGIRKLGACTSLASPNASHYAARRTPPPSKINRKRQYIHVIIACVTVRWPCGCLIRTTCHVYGLWISAGAPRPAGGRGVFDVSRIRITHTSFSPQSFARGTVQWPARRVPYVPRVTFTDYVSRAMPESVVTSAHTTLANLWQPERQRQCAHIKGVGGGMRNTYA